MRQLNWHTNHRWLLTLGWSRWTALLRLAQSMVGETNFGNAFFDNGIVGYAPNCSPAYPPFLESLEGVLRSTPAGDSNAHVGNETWKGVIGTNGTPVQNSSGVLLLDFCAHHELSITITMFKHKGVHMWTWHQDTLGSMIDFVVGSMDLWPHVLDTQV